MVSTEIGDAVHQIRLGAVVATIWETWTEEGSDYHVTISRLREPGSAADKRDQFMPDDLPLIAEVADMAHLWICEQAVMFA